MDILIKNATLLPFDEKTKVINNGFVIISDDTIKKIGKMADLDKTIHFDTEIDANDKIITPGLINAHTHVPMTLFRGLGEDMKDRLFKLFFPLEAGFLTPEFIYDSALLGCSEMISGGVTCIGDMYYFENRVADALEKIGMRGVLGETVANFKAPDCTKPYEGIDLSLDFIKEYKNHTLITPTFAPHAPYSVDIEHLKEINQKADENDIQILTHLSEFENESELIATRVKGNIKDLSPIAYLEKEGALSSKWTGAHLIFSNEEDRQILKKHHISTVHCPLANAKSGKGISKVPEMQKLGINVALGTDGPLSGNRLSLFHAMTYAFSIHKLRFHDTEIMSCYDILKLATINGAKMLGLEDKIGSLEVGKKADIVIWKNDTPTMGASLDPFADIVLNASEKDVDIVFINGEIVYKNNTLQKINFEKQLFISKNWNKKVKEYVNTLNI